MYNITFANNQILKIYNSDENKVNGTLTLTFLPSDYTLEEIRQFFDHDDIKECLKEIIKTTNIGQYITTFTNYTLIKTKASLVLVDVKNESLKEIPSLDESGQEIIVTVPTTEIHSLELIKVILGYENPTDFLINKLNQQINPTININSCTIEELKIFVQKRNRESLEAYLEKNPLLYVDGKYYGVSKIDRDEMSQQLLVYQLNKTINPSIEDAVKWHSKGSKCILMPIKDFTKLAIAIYDYIEPYYEKMQEIKEKIMACDSKDSILVIKLFNEI